MPGLKDKIFIFIYLPSSQLYSWPHLTDDWQASGVRAGLNMKTTCLHTSNMTQWLGTSQEQEISCLNQDSQILGIFQEKQ